MSEPATFRLDEAIALLSRTPGLLDAWLRDLPEPWLRADEGPETFSPLEVVGHLISGERHDWIPRARHILEHRPGPFEPFDRFGHRQESADRPIEDLLDTFATLRATNLETLHSFQLVDDHFVLSAEHPDFGAIILRQLLATWVVHDQGHIAQIARVLAKRYRLEVGPWEEYLPVLGDRVGG